MQQKEATRSELIDLFAENLCPLLKNERVVLDLLSDRDLKKGIAVSLYYVNVIKLDKHRGRVLEQIAQTLDIPVSTLRKWITPARCRGLERLSVQRSTT